MVLAVIIAFPPSERLRAGKWGPPLAWSLATGREPYRGALAACGCNFVC